MILLQHCRKLLNKSAIILKIPERANYLRLFFSGRGQGCISAQDNARLDTRLLKSVRELRTDLAAFIT